LLTARGLTEAVKLLDSALFSIFPGTNHFGDDDFHVLQAEVALAEYEHFRLARETKRQAARDLAQTIMESGGPYSFRCRTPADRGSGNVGGIHLSRI